MTTTDKLTDEALEYNLARLESAIAGFDDERLPNVGDLYRAVKKRPGDGIGWHYECSGITGAEIRDAASALRELLAHRRASQAAPVPQQKPVAWAETDHKGKVIGVSMNQYPWHPTPLYAQAPPAPSDALREENERLRYVLDGVRGAISTGRNEPLMVWLDQINIALSTPTEERQ